MSENLKKLKITVIKDSFFTTNIKAICLDIDGVLTDGTLLISESGDLLRTMNTKDGYALKRIINAGFPLAVITGGKSIGVVRRLRNLGINDIFIGIHDKLPIFYNWCKNRKIDPTSVLYVGDDIPDMKIMKACGCAACPDDAVEEIKNISGYISPFKGGRGCVRDICFQVLEVHNFKIS